MSEALTSGSPWVWAWGALNTGGCPVRPSPRTMTSQTTNTPLHTSAHRKDGPLDLKNTFSHPAGLTTAQYLVGSIVQTVVEDARRSAEDDPQTLRPVSPHFAQLGCLEQLLAFKETETTRDIERVWSMDMTANDQNNSTTAAPHGFADTTMSDNIGPDSGEISTFDREDDDLRFMAQYDRNDFIPNARFGLSPVLDSVMSDDINENRLGHMTQNGQNNSTSSIGHELYELSSTIIANKDGSLLHEDSNRLGDPMRSDNLTAIFTQQEDTPTAGNERVVGKLRSSLFESIPSEQEGPTGLGPDTGKKIDTNLNDCIRSMPSSGSVYGALSRNEAQPLFSLQSEQSKAASNVFPQNEGYQSSATPPFSSIHREGIEPRNPNNSSSVAAVSSRTQSASLHGLPRLPRRFSSLEFSPMDLFPRLHHLQENNRLQQSSPRPAHSPTTDDPHASAAHVLSAFSRRPVDLSHPRETTGHPPHLRPATQPRPSSSDENKSSLSTLHSLPVSQQQQRPQSSNETRNSEILPSPLARSNPGFPAINSTLHFRTETGSTSGSTVPLAQASSVNSPSRELYQNRAHASEESRPASFQLQRTSIEDRSFPLMSFEPARTFGNCPPPMPNPVPTTKTTRKRKTTSGTKPAAKKLKVDKPKIVKPKPVRRSAASDMPDALWMRIFEFAPPRFLPKARLISQRMKAIVDRYTSIHINCRKENFGHDMPSPPEGISDRQYNNLLEGKGCQNEGCDDKRAARTHWSWFKRWCYSCWQEKIIREDKLFKIHAHTYSRPTLTRLFECIAVGMQDSFIKPHDFVDDTPGHPRGPPRLYRVYLQEDVTRIFEEYEALTPEPYKENPEHTPEQKADAQAAHQKLMDELEDKRTAFFTERKAKNVEHMAKVVKIEEGIRMRRIKIGKPNTVNRAARKALFTKRAAEDLPHIPEDFVHKTKAYREATRVYRDGGSERGWLMLKPKIAKEWEESENSGHHTNVNAQVDSGADEIRMDPQTRTASPELMDYNNEQLPTRERFMQQMVPSLHPSQSHQFHTNAVQGQQSQSSIQQQARLHSNHMSGPSSLQEQRYQAYQGSNSIQQRRLPHFMPTASYQRYMALNQPLNNLQRGLNMTDAQKAMLYVPLPPQRHSGMFQTTAFQVQNFQAQQQQQRPVQRLPQPQQALQHQNPGISQVSHNEFRGPTSQPHLLSTHHNPTENTSSQNSASRSLTNMSAGFNHLGSDMQRTFSDNTIEQRPHAQHDSFNRRPSSVGSMIERVNSDNFTPPSTNPPSQSYLQSNNYSSSANSNSRGLPISSLLQRPSYNYNSYMEYDEFNRSFPQN